MYSGFIAVCISFTFIQRFKKKAEQVATWQTEEREYYTASSVFSSIKLCLTISHRTDLGFQDELFPYINLIQCGPCRKILTDWGCSSYCTDSTNLHITAHLKAINTTVVGYRGFFCINITTAENTQAYLGHSSLTFLPSASCLWNMTLKLCILCIRYPINVNAVKHWIN